MTSAVDISTSATLALGTNRIIGNATTTATTNYTDGSGLFNIKKGASLTVTADEGTSTSVGGISLSSSTNTGRVFNLTPGGSITMTGGYYDTSAYDSASKNFLNRAILVNVLTLADSAYSLNSNGKYYSITESGSTGSITMTNVNASLAQASAAVWVFKEDETARFSSGNKKYWMNSEYTVNVTGGSYKVAEYTGTTKKAGARAMFGVDGTSTFDGVTIENDVNPGIYVYSKGIATVKNTTVNITGTVEEGNAAAGGSGWGVNALAAALGGTLNVESGTYTSQAHVLGVFSSGGTINVVGNATFNQGEKATSFALNQDFSNTYKDCYDESETPSSVNISSGTFNLQDESKFAIKDDKNNTLQKVNVNGGRFSHDISSFVANTDFAYQTSSTVGDYYYVGTKGNNWNPVSKDAADTTKAAATNTTWHYFSSSTATSPVATLEGSGSTLTFTTATGVPEPFAISLQDILNGNTNGYTALDATAATVNLAIGGTSKITKITGGSHDDTLVAGSDGSFLNGYDGNDSLVGGTGKDTFSYNAGADTVSGYDGDLVVLDGFKASDATFTADSSNISLNFGANDRLIFEGVGTNAISVQSGKDTYVYRKEYVTLNNGVTLASNYFSVPTTSGVNTFDASTTSFATIDASPVTTSGGVYVSGNSLDNKIFGATAGGSLYGGTGNDLLDVNDRSTGSNFTFQYTAGADTVDGFVENNDQLSIDSALRADITSAKSSTSQLIFNFSNQSNVLTFKGDDIEKVSLTGGGFLTKDGVVTSNSLDLFSTAKGRIDLTDTPYKGTDINSVNAEKVRNQSVTLVGGSVGGALTLANNHKKDLFIYGGGDVSITNYENDTDKIDLENYSIKGFQIANTNDVSLNVAYGTNSQIMSIAGAAQAEVLIHDANGKNNSYNKIVFYQNGVLHNKAKRPTIATISAGASDYQADNSIKKIFVTGGASGIAITAGNNKTTLDASEAGGVSLYGGAKNDKLIGNATKADNFFYSAGKDIIEGYDTSDQISLTGDDFNIGDAKITLSKSSLKFKFSNKNTLTLKNSDLSTIKVDGEEYTFAKNAYSDGDGENVSLTSQFSGTYKIKDEDAGKITAVDGSAVKKNLTFKGSEKAETFTGGQKKTTFKGGGGGDVLVGGTGKDIFFYAKGDAGTNIIQSFDFTSDRIKIANGTIKDVSTTASGIQFEMTSGKRGDTATAGSFVLASSIASGGSGETTDIVPSNVFIKANNTHYWFAKESGTDINGNAYAIGDLITASTKVTRAQANETGYAILDLGYSTNLAKTSVAVKASETFTFDSTDGVKKKT